MKIVWTIAIIVWTTTIFGENKHEIYIYQWFNVRSLIYACSNKNCFTQSKRGLCENGGLNEHDLLNSIHRNHVRNHPYLLLANRMHHNHHHHHHDSCLFVFIEFNRYLRSDSVKFGTMNGILYHIGTHFVTCSSSYVTMMSVCSYRTRCKHKFLWTSCRFSICRYKRYNLNPKIHTQTLGH